MAFEVFDNQAPEGSGPPPHTHPWEEAYVLLEGELMILRGAAEFVLRPGQAVHIPAMMLHCYRVLTSTAHLVTVTSPAGASGLFVDLDSTVEGPDDLRGIMTAARRHEVDSPLFT
jgi:hypothetical protein